MCNQKEELLKKVKELKQQIEQLDNEYPKYYMLATASDRKYDQFIVKFTGLNTGAIVAKTEDVVYDIGDTCNDWVEHTSSEWVETTNPKELCDKDLIECWDNDHTHAKSIRFYDAISNRAFSACGERRGVTYDNYKKFMPWEYPEWAIEAQKTLKN